MKLREILDHVNLDLQPVEIRQRGDTVDQETVFSSREDGTDVPEELLDMEVGHLWVKDYELCNGREPPLEIDLLGEWSGAVDESKNSTITFEQLRKLVMEGVMDDEDNGNYTIVCTAEDRDSFAKMSRYLTDLVGRTERDYDTEFDVERSPHDLTISITGSSVTRLDEIEYTIRKYLQARDDAGWDRTIAEA